jgi:hypothetical protein
MAYGKIPTNYINIFEIAKLEGVDTKKLKNAISCHGVNAAKYIEQLEPIGHQFREFEKGTRKSYAIAKTIYEFWKKNGTTRGVSSGRTQKWDKGEFFNINKRIPKHLWDRFSKIIKVANLKAVTQVSHQDMLAVAIKEFCDRRSHILGGDDS